MSPVRRQHYSTPYDDVLHSLVSSVMKAMGEVAVVVEGGGSLSDVSDAQLNRHFTWLCIAYHEGTNRHLFDGSDYARTYPLRTDALRDLRQQEEVRSLLENHSALPISVEEHEGSLSVASGAKSKIERHYVQLRPTRISSLIRQRWADYACLVTSESRVAFSVPSPLSIVLDILTDPAVPSTRAFSLVAVRNFLFEELDVLPSFGEKRGSKTFSASSIPEGLSSILTSIRPRFQSRGADKLPESHGSDRVLRHYLAVRRHLVMRFRDPPKAVQYLKGGSYAATNNNDLEFGKSGYMAFLPDAGEIENELFGLPIPIRGADILFKGGISFASSGGLVLSISGGPGSGKTTMALSLAATLSPLGIRTVFLTCEETQEDLTKRATEVVPLEFRRLSFYQDTSHWLTVVPITGNATDSGDWLDSFEADLNELSTLLVERTNNHYAVPNPCKAVIVLDGLHELVTDSTGRLSQFIRSVKALNALVVLTSSAELESGTTLAYLSDAVVSLGQTKLDDYGEKPDRQITLTKMRHQICALGTHGVLFSGDKGFRFSPQVNYQLDSMATWEPFLPDRNFGKNLFCQAFSISSNKKLKQGGNADLRQVIESGARKETKFPITIYKGSHVFINGEGSGGKAALAIKLAMSPLLHDDEDIYATDERVLLVSFLYPPEYYDELFDRLKRKIRVELRSVISRRGIRPNLEIIHLYPGYLKPNDLFNRIFGKLRAAELEGRRFTTVIIDGIHNLFLQFPVIEQYRIFWPQLYNSLRQWPVMVITTHSTLVVPSADRPFTSFHVDDERSEPLRHALVQKTDFTIEVNRIDPPSDQEELHGQQRDLFFEKMPSEYRMDPGLNVVTIREAIGQPIPRSDYCLYWHREKLLLFQ